MRNFKELLDLSINEESKTLDLNKLEEMILAQEDGIADYFRLAAVQYGLFAAIVDEVLADSGLGTPLSKEDREAVHTRWHACIDENFRAPE